MILDEIRLKRTEQLNREKAKIPFSEIKKAAEKKTEPCQNFKKAITPISKNEMAIIAEVKRLLPQKALYSRILTPLKRL